MSHFSSSIVFCSFICLARANRASQSYFSPYSFSMNAIASLSTCVEYGCAPGSLCIIAMVMGKSGRPILRRWNMLVASLALQGMFVVSSALPMSGKSSSKVTPVSAEQREHTSAGRPKLSATSM